MRKIYFTADTHFGHMFALAKRRRPFPSLEAMDAFLIARWNETVGADDEVYHLGDFAHGEHEDIGGVVARLNGRLHLVLGNNDERSAMEATGRFASIAEMREMKIGGAMHLPLPLPVARMAERLARRLAPLRPRARQIRQ